MRVGTADDYLAAGVFVVDNLPHWQSEAGDPAAAAAAFAALPTDHLRVLGPDHPDHPPQPRP